MEFPSIFYNSIVLCGVHSKKWAQYLLFCIFSADIYEFGFLRVDLVSFTAFGILTCFILHMFTCAHMVNVFPHYVRVLEYLNFAHVHIILYDPLQLSPSI